jgi:two-component system, chemotaxis family, protein-glutamate methylesterase/glutaminase
MEIEADMAELDPGAMHQDDRPGTPSGFACPECHGVLWELRDGELVRFRCRVGHAHSTESLLAEQTQTFETALWTALRALEEKAALVHRLAHRADERGNRQAAARFFEQAQDAEQGAEMIRQALANGKGSERTPPAASA